MKADTGKFPLVFERGKPGRRAYRYPACDVPEKPLSDCIEIGFLRQSDPLLPEISEPELIRHYTALSRRTFSVDSGFYPLGSCTMKYNPRINEDAAGFAGFRLPHPLAPGNCAQGTLRLMHELLKALCEITGMAWGTLQPFAGAHGEFTGMKIFTAWFAHNGEGGRRKILVPDSAHGTNPASARLAGMEVVEIKSDSRGLVSVESIKPHLDDSLAGIMLTNPNTLGLFETEIQEIAGLVHEAGGLLYYDGANFNALLGKARPGDMGFDVVHLNLHKTFSTPHGGGGPGSGPVLVASSLVPFLPVPDVVRQEGMYSLDYGRPLSIGRVSGFYGNIAVLVRAYAYILSMGSDGLKKAGEIAVLNANYLKEKLKIFLPAAYDSLCKHEFVLSAKNLKEKTGVSAMHIAKRLLDYGVHPPTVYFPLIVTEALMLEPTETETRETLDEFVDIIREICAEAGENGEMVRNAPWTTPVRRIDEVRASRNPVLRWYPKKEGPL